jgi:catechol 2,3-dioxygenase-like lactoylglutathione lyase family enzyme
MGGVLTMNHIHIGTKDLGASREFYESFFGFKKKFDHGDGVFLVDDSNFLLAIDLVKDLPTLPDWFHLGFCLNNKGSVKSIYDKMHSKGIKFAKEYQEYGDDAAAFYVFDPDGYMIEVSWHRD